MTRPASHRAVATVMWRRLDMPGHDLCQLIRHRSGWALEGCAVFLHERIPCVLSYAVSCDRAFRTLAAHVHGWLGRTALVFDATRDPDNNWRLNGKPARAVRGCVDVDINVSPSTNLLTLRRLRPRRGRMITVRAAWLEFPEAKLKPLEQTYRRTSTDTYDYRAPALDFSSQMVVNRHGMVLEYPPLWAQERNSS